MSLQKKLLQAGLMSKKQARKVNQHEKNKRKKDRGNRKKKSKVLAEQNAKKTAELKAKQEAKLEARRNNDSLQMARARALQIHQLICHHQISYRAGNEVYWHYSVSRKSLSKLMLPPSLIHGLQQGNLAVVVKGKTDDFNVNFVIVPKHVGDKISQYEPERLVSI